MLVDGPAHGRARELAVDVGLGLAVAVAWRVGFELASGGDWLPVDPGAWKLAGLCLGVAVTARRAAGPWVLGVLALAYPIVYFRPLVSSFHLVPLLVLGFGSARRTTHRAGAVLESVLVGAAVLVGVAILFSPVVEASSRTPRAVLDALRAEPLDRFTPGGPLVLGGPAVVEATGQGPRSDRVRLPTNWSGLALAEFAALSTVLLGAALASQRQVARDLADRNGELERLRRAEAQRAVADERLRISRDLHDVVAHHLTAILMRSQAADRVRTSRPDEAHDAVAWIAEESRDALRATRATIHALRDAAPDGPARADGDLVADLGQIVERVGQVGLHARLTVRWDEEPALAPSVGVAVRRVVQESLTNVLKHAGASQALVTLQAVQGGLGIDVIDDGARSGGPAPEPTTGPGGAGLLGMQERLAACGGRLRYGPTAAGGWQVRLWVPVLPGAGR